MGRHIDFLASDYGAVCTLHRARAGVIQRRPDSVMVLRPIRLSAILLALSNDRNWPTTDRVRTLSATPTREEFDFHMPTNLSPNFQWRAWLTAVPETGRQ